MSEESAVLEATSIEAPAMEASRGPLVNLTPDQRTEFRKTGELPVTPKKSEEAATSSESKPVEGEAKPAGESETPENKQESAENKAKPKQTASERIAELRATIAKIEKGAGIKSEHQAEATAAKPTPQPVQQIQATRPKPTAEDKKEDGTPKFDTYEDFVEDLSDWKAEQREASNKRDTAQREQAKALNAKVEEAKSRYENFGDVVGPAVDAIVNDAAIPHVVKAMIDDSDIFADLIYTIGSSKEELASFVKMAKENPGKAIRYIALTESLINQELEGKTLSKVEEPAKPKTQAARPPSEVGGRGSTPPDSLEAAAKANDFRSFKAEATRRELAKMKS